ncbi:MAG TPA: hypothetical protein VGY54_09620 [Polyangiaceae bacterium]|jgi:hypothetical protein|nr:hypothetical protein [Polyangiaceae bacterium]
MSARRRDPSKKELLLAIDGPHARPSTIEDPVPFLEMAATWFRLATRVADAGNHHLRFRGLSIRNKCVAFATTPSNLRIAQVVAARTARIVAGNEDAPKGADVTTDEVRHIVRALGEHRVAVHIGDWVKPIAVPEDIGLADQWERTELRVQPIRVGGLDTTAKLASRSERVAFTVNVPDEEHARLLGANLYRDIDVELRLRRGDDGVIKAGTVLDVHPLDAAHPAESWRAWFQKNAGEWGDVDNILTELGRSH